jgi:hypothetical protein
MDQAVTLASRIAEGAQESLARAGSSALYNAASAVQLAWEATRPGADARRALVARFVLAHRLAPQDPLAPREEEWERPAAARLLEDKAAALQEVAGLLA